MNTNEKGARSFQRGFQLIQAVGYPPAINEERRGKGCYAGKGPADGLIVR
jgi:hypothetical protein